MAQFNQIANQDQQESLGGLPSELFAFLPLRTATLAPPTEETTRLLQEALTCKICKKLMQAPVYLKCSHRFCRPCIEHRLRSSSKKTCPICSMPLLSKRELRPDYFTLDFIDHAFGEAKLSQSLEETKVEQGQKEKSKKVEGKMKIRRKDRKRDESLEIEAAARQPRKKKCENILKVQNNIGDNPSDGKGSTFIGNSDSYEAEQLEQLQRVKVQKQRHFKYEQGGETEDHVLFDQEVRNAEEIEKQINNPQIKYGVSYFKELKYKHRGEIMLTLTLQAHPMKPFTPRLSFSEIDCPALASGETIFELISQELNIDPELVDLYVVANDRLDTIYPDDLLAELNQLYWPENSSFSLFDLKTAHTLLNNFPDSKEKKLHPPRLIYFSVEFKSKA